MRNLEGELGERGYIRLRAISKAETSLDIARRIGLTMFISEVSPVQQLIPRTTAQAFANSYSGLFGLAQFPLHTDMAHWYVPPRYLLLRCTKAAPEVKTLVLHSRQLFEDEDELALHRALFRPRRRLDGRLTSLRLYERGRYRWDPVFVVPITTSAFELRDRIHRRIETKKVEELSLEDPTDCILLDNWSVLHGRTEVPLECVHRKIERVYLDSVH